MNTPYKFLMLATIFLPFLLGCSQQGTGSRAVSQPVAEVMLKPGEKIGAMVVSSGVKRAIPL